jgi:putative hemin transport protein
MYRALPELGTVMASARNPYAVIEKTGAFDKVDIGEHVGLVLDEDIDLRLFMGRYGSAYGVVREHLGKPLRSVQFFGKDGEAIQKVYVRKSAGFEAYDAFVARFAAEDSGAPLEVEPAKAPPAPEPDEAIDVEAFQAAWLAMQDTHEFFGMLRAHGVTRTQGLRLAPEGHALRVREDAAARMLEAASADEVPIMAFVGNPGCIEIHTGPVKKIAEMGDWLNVLDPTFNLHLDRGGVTESWLVRKPTEDGIVTSLELFDAQGRNVVMFFGARKPGIPEDPRWRELVTEAVAP